MFPPWGISILADFGPTMAVVVFGLGKNLLFKSTLGSCVQAVPLNIGLGEQLYQYIL